MKSWLFVGAKVVCVNARPRPGRSFNGGAPTEGEVCTIQAIGIGHFGEVCIALEEHPRTVADRFGFAAWRFRPAITMDDTDQVDLAPQGKTVGA